MSRRVLFAASFATLSGLLLSACTLPPAPVDPPENETTSHESPRDHADAKADPVIPEDTVDSGAALRAAEELIVRYLEARRAAYASRGMDMADLASLTTQDIEVSTQQSIEDLKEMNYTLITTRTVEDLQFERLANQDGELHMVVSGCLDFSEDYALHHDGRKNPLADEFTRIETEITIQIGDPSALQDLRVSAWDDYRDEPC